MKERDIFDAALAIIDPGKRDAFLGAACGGDAALEEHLRGLLDAERGMGSFLEAPASAPTLTMAPPRGAERAGTAIGPYKLLEQIGEGGMGVVYMAEQVQPVRRRVALKVIRPGMDSRQVVARFEAERQALALMDHPNIARVHDAGATEAGRPYFVMELVRGLPITEYCDREGLTVPERLELFVLVCRAVQHAHQKGVIHRDLKPSNVLVAVIDGVPMPKVIDFGVAKATGGGLTDRTLFTGFHQMVGTPLYMSPEQADLSSADVDTRSDIYALGVLLYELLTGSTPFDRDTFAKAAFDEMRRMIREDEPPTPSTRLGSLGQALTTVSARRGSDPRHLNRAVRGELDWIAMKALEKDRRRRYETANDFAADVLRYLDDRPVEACPPSAWYRFRKSARRNRVALTTVGLVGLALVIGIVVSTGQAVRAVAAEHRAEDHLDLARRAVDEMYDQVAVRWQNDVRWGPLPRAFLEKTLPFYQRFAATRRVDPEVGRAHMRVGEILCQLDRGGEAGQALRRAEAIFRALRVVDPENPEHTRDLAACYSSRAMMGGESPPHRDAIALYEELASRFPGDLRNQRDLANVLANRGVRLWWTQQAGAEADLGRARMIQERLFAAHPDDPDLCRDLGATLRDLGNRCRDVGRPDEGERYQRRALSLHEGLIDRHPTRPQYLLHFGWDCWELGRTLVSAGKYEELPKFSARAATIFEGLANDYPDVIWFRRFQAQALADLAKGQFQTGRHAEAEQTLRRLEGTGEDSFIAEQFGWIAGEISYSDDPKLSHPVEAIELLKRSLRLRPEGSAFITHALGAAHFRAGETDAAIRELEQAVSQLKDDPHFGTGFYLAMAYHRKGDEDRARAWYDRSVAWMVANEPKDRFLLRYRAEAAALMGLDAKQDGARPPAAREEKKPPD